MEIESTGMIASGTISSQLHLAALAPRKESLIPGTSSRKLKVNSLIGVEANQLPWM